MAILAALEGAGHSVVPVGIDVSGAWKMVDRARRPLVAEGDEVTLSIPAGTLRAGDREVEFDVVFPVLHGPYGEDGTIQGALEIAGIPYVGSGVTGSAVGMEKDFAKQLLASAGLPTVRYETAGRSEWDADPAAVVDRLTEGLGYPMFVKPIALGSSVGVARVGDHETIKQGIESAFAYGDAIIIEEAVVAREIEVALLDGPRVSVPGEIIIEHEWYSYEAKYEDATSRFETPARLTDSQVAEVQRMAATAFTTLRLQGPVRVDFFFEEGRRGFLVNEVNTMPGFTPGSGYPLMWQASGMSYPALCDELVKLAWRTTASPPGR